MDIVPPFSDDPFLMMLTVTVTLAPKQTSTTLRNGFDFPEQDGDEDDESYA